MNYQKRDQFFRNYVNFKKAFQKFIDTGLEGTQVYEVIVHVHVYGYVEQYKLTIRLFKNLPIFQNIPFKVQIQCKLLQYLQSMARRIELNKPLLKNLYTVLKAQGNKPLDNGLCKTINYVEIVIREKLFSQLILSRESNALSQKYLRSPSNQSSHESITVQFVETKCQNNNTHNEGRQPCDSPTCRYCRSLLGYCCVVSQASEARESQTQRCMIPNLTDLLQVSQRSISLTYNQYEHCSLGLFQSQQSQFQKQMDFQNGFMDRQLLLLGAVRQLLDIKFDSISAPLKVNVLIKLRQMFVVMKEHAKCSRSAYAFQILLAHLQKKTQQNTFVYHK